MLIAVIPWVQILAALGALAAGAFFASAAIALRGLRGLPIADGIKATNAINGAAAKPLKTLLFAISLSCLVLVVALVWSWDRLWHDAERGAILGIAGAVIYIVGGVIVTFERNVPLNKLLDNATDASGEMVWRIYVRDWVKWNHVRTATCAVACALLISGAVLQSAKPMPPPYIADCMDIVTGNMVPCD